MWEVLCYAYNERRARQRPSVNPYEKMGVNKWTLAITKNLSLTGSGCKWKRVVVLRKKPHLNFFNSEVDKGY